MHFYWNIATPIYLFCIICCARDCMAFFLEKVHQLLLQIKKRRLNLEP